MSEYVLSLKPNKAKAMINKADALTGLADEIPKATARNYYLSSVIVFFFKQKTAYEIKP